MKCRSRESKQSVCFDSEPLTSNPVPSNAGRSSAQCLGQFVTWAFVE